MAQVERELKAIDSEHRNNVPVDGWRVNQVFKQGLHSHHPGSGFSTGNLETLGGRGNAALHEALLAFHHHW